MFIRGKHGLRRHQNSVEINSMLIRINSNNRPRLHLKRCCALVLYTSNTNQAVEIPFGIFTAPSNRHRLIRRYIFPAILIPDPIIDDVRKVSLLHPDAVHLFKHTGYVLPCTAQLQHELLALVGVGDGQVCSVKPDIYGHRGTCRSPFGVNIQVAALEFISGPRSTGKCVHPSFCT